MAIGLRLGMSRTELHHCRNVTIQSRQESLQSTIAIVHNELPFEDETKNSKK